MRSRSPPGTTSPFSTTTTSSPDALWENARAIAARPALDFLYSDEDTIDVDGRRFDPAFKPDWSPELLRSTMYTGHLTVYRTALVRALGGFRSDFDGTQDFDLALRVADATEAIHHIPKVLYHWRSVPGSAAGSVAAKPDALAAQRRSLESWLARNHVRGRVLPTAFPGNWRVVYEPPDPRPLVSIVMPTAGRSRRLRGREVDLARHCVASILRTTDYAPLEIVVVHNGDLAPATQRFLEGCSAVRLVLYSEPS